MNPTAFSHPEWALPLLLGVAACTIAMAAARARARSRCRRLLGRDPMQRTSGRWSDGALLLAVAAIAVALLGPRLGERVIRTPITGVDVVFLVDVSRSMDARDVPPSRLDRARRAAEEILARLAPGDRAGLAVFAGRGLLLAPLTPDHEALVDLLRGLDTALIAPASSDLGAGVTAALTGFESGSERPRVVVVASDGEDPDRDRELGAEAARTQRARVVTIALGSEAGAVVPDGARPLRDRDGATVSSRRQRERLAALATATDGRAFVGDTWGRIDFAGATAAVRRDAGAAVQPDVGEPKQPPDRRIAGGWVERRVAATRSVPFAALAFALLLLEALSRGPWRWPRAAAPLATTAAAITVVAAGFTAGAPAAEDREPRGGSVEAVDRAAARVRARPDDARAQIELGLASLEAGRNEDAARAFETATVFAQSPAIAAVAYYDLGVAAFALGDVNAARDAYFAALELDPADERARFNLEWTLGSAQAPEATLPPETEPDAVETRDTPSGADDARESVPEIPEMSAAQRRRWLERAADDPTHWLRSAAGDPEGPSARAARPAW